ncbi:response regulator [Paenibacillus qinlingensis]|uniref:Two-component system response regulator YesN n=1 Tax=Paenibacillus qinlingensis TaxID=1837343 RepID=A0ABU1NY88_9BACL|nr:response regulator [Paenibacillus qinlingensis]MDR6552254.1 two-component system response regulator YesN [Paenibacillus qinlingensis]
MYHVFIADDDRIIRTGLRKIIEKNCPEWTVIGEASNGQQAYEDILVCKPDLLITDIKMPVLDGVELIRKVKAQQDPLDRMKIIVLSGFGEYPYVRETLRQGAVDYLLKPIPTPDIVALLQKIRDDHALEQESSRRDGLLKDRSEEAQLLVEEKALLQFLHARAQDVEPCKQKLRDCGLADSGNFLIAILQVHQNNPLILETIKNDVLSLVPQMAPMVRVMLALRGTQVIAVFCGNKEFVHFKNVVQDALNIQADNWKSVPDTKVSCGISDVFTLLDELPNGAKEAERALETGFYENAGAKFLTSQDESNMSTIASFPWEPEVQQITSLMELGDFNQAKDVLMQLLVRLEMLQARPVNVKDVCKKMVTRMEVACREFAEASSNKTANGQDLFAAIDLVPTMKDLIGLLAEDFTDRTTTIQNRKSERSIRIIEIAKEYIQQHFREDLMLQSVADRVCLNPFYFSKLFKDQTGKSFTNFLIEARMKEAKKLLAMPEIKVYEVGGMVGYEEPESFSRAFKKLVGVSPTEYRKKIK